MPRLASAHTPGRGSFSAYQLAAKISNRRFVGSGTNNPMAVDRQGDTYVFVATRSQQGSIPSATAPDVEELSPSGRRIRSFPTTFHRGGKKHYLQVGGLAVTPSGSDVLVVGNSSTSLHGLLESKPFLAKYSARTGAFLKGYAFDGDQTRLGEGVAIDPTGHHVYAGDQRNPFIGRTTARVYEFDVSGLEQIDNFKLAGNDVCCDLAVAPDGSLFAQIGPPHSTEVLIQQYSATGAFKNQFVSPPLGLAVGPTGDIFAASRAKSRIERLSPTGKLRDTLGAGHFTGFPVAGAVDRSGDVYAFDEARNDVATILKFAPIVPQTTITAHPPAALTTATATATATFKFKSSIPGAELECRLRMAGASAQAFKRCARSRTYDALSNGSYTFQVRSVSPAGPTDPTPASFHFHVQILYPTTTITSSPASTIGVPAATFKFTSSSAGATFACRLTPAGASPAAFRSCPSPVTYVQLNDGTWKFEVQSITSHGVTDPSPATATFTIDTRPPTVTAPASPTIPVGEQLGLDGTLGVDESWSASDTYSASSELLYTIEQRAGAGLTSLGSFAATPTLESVKGVTSASVPIAPNGLYHQLRVQAANQLGVSAEGPAGDPFQLSVIDNTDAGVSYTSGWALTSDATAYRGGLQSTSATGASATMTFSGRFVAVISPLGPSYGPMRVCLDPIGVAVTGCTSVTLHATTTAERDAVYVSGPLAAGAHSIRVSETSGPIALDGFVVLG